MANGNALRIVGALLAIMLTLHFSNAAFGYPLNAFGLQPRSADGLVGIALAPFLHGSIGHLLSNAVPFAFLSMLILGYGVGRYALVSALVISLGGFLVWVFGREAIHVGSSGWVFGLWGFLIGQAWFTRSLRSVLIALLVVFLYGGLVFGFLPRHGVSFESHIFGAIAGFITAWLLRTRPTISPNRPL